MKKMNLSKLLSLVLCLVLVAAMALMFTGCTDDVKNETTAAPETTTESISSEEETTTEAPETTSEEESTTEATPEGLVDGSTIGEGETSFTLVVTDKDGNDITVTVLTDKATVGEALLELGVIAGEESEYGLYVKTVNGTTLDYATDGMYWAFYIDGEYAMTGVDSTDIVAGSTYALKAE